MIPDRQSIPAGPVRTESEVRRSRFIAHLTIVADRKSAEQEIAQRRREHPQASHVVYAYITGDSRSEISGMSDDGEPKGTAGRPVMEVLKGSGLTNTLITVVRYYGGTKLGTGGLVRAYGDAARSVLLEVERIPYRVLWEYTLNVPYELHQAVRALIGDLGVDVEIRRESYSDQVELVLAISQDTADPLQRSLQDVSRGTLFLDPPAESVTDR